MTGSMRTMCDVQAKKKAQQEAAAKRTGGKAGQAKPVGPSKNPQVPQSDSSDSDAEEEEEHSVLQQDSRFASLLSDITPAVGVEGSDKAVAGGPQPEQAGSLADGSAAGSYGPDSDNEVEAGHEGQHALLLCLADVTESTVNNQAILIIHRQFCVVL